MLGWPFDSTVTEDGNGNPVYSRAYSADALAKFIATLLSNGAFCAQNATCLKVLAGTGMNVSVQPGKCNINGRLGNEETTRTISFQASDSSLDRIDTVVCRLNLGIAALNVDLYVVEGTAASTPAAPSLTRNASIFELGLANVFVPHGSTSITQERITDTRLDSARCGAVVVLLDEVDLTGFFTQFQAALDGYQTEFETWFALIQDTLDGYTAGNLLNLINKHKAKNAVITLAVADWTLTGGVYLQTESVAIVPANCAIHVAPAWASRVAYNDAECGMSAASAGSVTFTAAAIPAAELTVNISVSEVDA